MGECIMKLIEDSRTGFKAEMGARIAGGEAGEQRYATPAMDCLNADEQYISVKDGKAIYTITLSGSKAFEVLDACIKRITDRYQHGRIKWSNIDYVSPKDGWSYFVMRASSRSPAIAAYCYSPNHKKIEMSIGPVVDMEELHYREQDRQTAARDNKFRTEYKSTGSTELDSINMYQHGTNLRGDYSTSLKIRDFFMGTVDDDYNNTVGEPFTTSDGRKLYRAPLWFGADDAYSRKDTSGWGTMLYLFFAAGKPGTEDMVATLRHLFSYSTLGVEASPGPHPFVYFRRNNASNILYRYDLSADAPYKVLTVVFTQSFGLKERRAAAAAEAARQAYYAEQSKRWQDERDAYNRAHPKKNYNVDWDKRSKERNAERAQQDKLHQESVDYYNKIHPYGEGANDDVGRPIQ